MNIGLNIKMLREANGLTQDKLAKILNISNKAISNYELGLRDLDIKILTKIAEVFNVKLEFLLNEKISNECDNALNLVAMSNNDGKLAIFDNNYRKFLTKFIYNDISFSLCGLHVCEIKSGNQKSKYVVIDNQGKFVDFDNIDYDFVVGSENFLSGFSKNGVAIVYSKSLDKDLLINCKSEVVYQSAGRLTYSYFKQFNQKAPKTNCSLNIRGKLYSELSSEQSKNYKGFYKENGPENLDSATLIFENGDIVKLDNSLLIDNDFKYIEKLISLYGFEIISYLSVNVFDNFTK